MKETELRIKNIVYHDYQKCFVIVTGMFLDSDEVWYCKLSEFNDDHEVNGDSSYRGPIQSFQPIPLTEEWLLKFGFEKHGACDAYPNGYYSHGNLEVNLDNEFSPAVSDPEGNCHYIGNSCEYVHQLQNLYFALTGEELTIRE
jgi:hypothetical protein